MSMLSEVGAIQSIWLIWRSSEGAEASDQFE